MKAVRTHLVFACLAWTQQMYSANIPNSEGENRRILSLNQGTVILTDSDSPDSFDPLNAKRQRNTRVMRLLYATPSQRDSQGNYYSQLFSSFVQTNAGKTIKFVLSQEALFSDGSQITLADISQSLLRVLWLRPWVQPLVDLNGARAWQGLAVPLSSHPQGMKLNIQENSLELHFSQAIENPWEKFSMLMFSIIPARCIDISSGQLSVLRPPGSGAFLLEQESENYFHFVKRKNGRPGVKNLSLLYISAMHLLKYLPYFASKHIILAHSHDIDPYHKKSLNEKLKINLHPETSFFVLLLNSKFPAFRDLKNRQQFLYRLREIMHGFHGRSEGSIFTKLFPGYLSMEELNKGLLRVESGEQQRILAGFKQMQMPWLWHCRNGDELYRRYLRQALAAMQIEGREIPPNNDFNQGIAEWERGEVALRSTFSSFSAEPLSDVRLYFITNLNPFFSEVQNDSRVRTMIAGFSPKSLSVDDLDKMFEFNRYLFEQSLCAVIANFSNYQLSTKDSVLPADMKTDDCSHYFSLD